METKFNEGDTVFERTSPTKKLVVSSYRNGLYYCKAEENPLRKELVYFERELKSGTNLSKAQVDNIERMRSFNDLK